MSKHYSFLDEELQSDTFYDPQNDKVDDLARKETDKLSQLTSIYSILQTWCRDQAVPLLNIENVPFSVLLNE